MGFAEGRSGCLQGMFALVKMWLGKDVVGDTVLRNFDQNQGSLFRGSRVLMGFSLLQGFHSL